MIASGSVLSKDCTAGMGCPQAFISRSEERPPSLVERRDQDHRHAAGSSAANKLTRIEGNRAGREQARR
jgi:hypothetical protein